MFNPDGTIPLIYFSLPEHVHDSQVAKWGYIYVKFETMFDKYGVCCAVDSGLVKIEKDFIVKSMTYN